MDKKEIKAKIIEIYKLPLVERLAIHYNSFKYFLLSLLIFIPLITILAVNNFSWKYFLYLIPLELLFIYLIIRGFNFLFDLWRYKAWGEKMKNNPDHSTIFSGPPGIGKSLATAHLVHFMQIGSWKKLQTEYFLLMGRLQKKGYEVTSDDMEIYESYQYFINNSGIPCLGTNIGFYSKIFKRYSYKLGPSYMKQERRAPFRLVGWYDEIGTVFNPDLFNDKSDEMKSLEMADMSRFCRQFAEFRFVGTEQEASNVYKNIRRVVARNRVFTSFEMIYKPKFLMWVYEKMINHFIEPSFGEGMKMSKAKKWSNFLYNFKKFIDNVGFFKLKYKDYSSLEGVGVTALTEKNERNTLYLPCCAEFKYDTRAFRFAYKPREMNINMQVFENMDLSKNEAETFLRSAYPKIKKKKE